MSKVVFILTALATMSCSSGYKKTDVRWTYVSSDEADPNRERPIDVDDQTFRVFENENYAVDKNHVYLLGKKIRNADPRTFKPLKNGYAKDLHNVFLEHELLISADPETFEILGFPYSRDNKSVFCGTLPLETDNVSEFEVVEEGGSLTTEETSMFVSRNPNYSWIDANTYPFVIYGKGKGRTSKEKFSGFKKIQ